MFRNLQSFSLGIKKDRDNIDYHHQMKNDHQKKYGIIFLISM